jgi:hypothetical protein
LINQYAILHAFPVSTNFYPLFECFSEKLGSMMTVIRFCFSNKGEVKFFNFEKSVFGVRSNQGQQKNPSNCN